MDKNKTVFLIHPGKSLEEALLFINMSQLELSNRTGIATKTINEIIKGKNPITPETALKFEKVLNIEAPFWNNLQKNYDELVERSKERNLMIKHTELVKSYSCYPQLVELGYVKAPENKNRQEIALEKFTNLLHFFSVSSLNQVIQTNGIAFRKADGEYSKENLAAWLRCAEIEAEKNSLPEYDEGKLKSKLDFFRSLTLLPPNFAQTLKDTCFECGVLIVYTPYFTKTRLNGAFRWFRNIPVVQLNSKGAYSDIFWFTFFHELGHLLKHGKKDEFIEFTNITNIDKKELEADDFAINTLIPNQKYIEFTNAYSNFSNTSIIEFANEVNIAPGVVAGRLAREKKITWPASLAICQVPLLS